MSDRSQAQFISAGRYTVIPRTLVYLRHGDAVLLLRGAPTKRRWANRYNGLGGHVEPGETIEAAARRELAEEAGISEVDDFALRGLINVEGQPTGVLLCVFTGLARTRAVTGSVEGTPEWIPLDRLDEIDLVREPPLLPHIFATDRILFGHQSYTAAGALGPGTFGP